MPALPQRKGKQQAPPSSSDGGGNGVTATATPTATVTIADVRAARREALAEIEGQETADRREITHILGKVRGALVHLAGKVAELAEFDETLVVDVLRTDMKKPPEVMRGITEDGLLGGAEIHRLIELALASKIEVDPDVNFVERVQEAGRNSFGNEMRYRVACVIAEATQNGLDLGILEISRALNEDPTNIGGNIRLLDGDLKTLGLGLNVVHRKVRGGRKEGELRSAPFYSLTLAEKAASIEAVALDGDAPTDAPAKEAPQRECKIEVSDELLQPAAEQIAAIMIRAFLSNTTVRLGTSFGAELGIRVTDRGNRQFIVESNMEHFALNCSSYSNAFSRMIRDTLSLPTAGVLLKNMDMN